MVFFLGGFCFALRLLYITYSGPYPASCDSRTNKMYVRKTIYIYYYILRTDACMYCKPSARWFPFFLFFFFWGGGGEFDCAYMFESYIILFVQTSINILINTTNLKVHFIHHAFEWFSFYSFLHGRTQTVRKFLYIIILIYTQQRESVGLHNIYLGVLWACVQQCISYFKTKSLLY